MEKHPLQFKTPELQTSPEVDRAVERQERETGEKLPNNPNERIEAYMDRLENVFLNPDERTRERNIELFRDKIYDALLIKSDHFPESYFDLQKRIARERGQAVEEIPENVREQMKDVAIEDQRHSLDAWMDYLASDDAVYPAWFKYFVWKNITKLSQFDKERGEFKKRTDTTVAPFPDIYREPLAQIADLYEKVREDNKTLKDPEIQESFSKKFPTLYAELIQESLASSLENREEIQGQWVKYQQGDNDGAEKLFESLEGKGTGWCTAGKSTAQTQIDNGDFYVYYTNDSNGEPTQPRLAIRMEGGNKIGEVRGILPRQGVEPLMQETLDEKLSEFGTEADAYRKKSNDMKVLTELEQKHASGKQFNKDDIMFLYEIDSKIKGFGYGRDPRIAELRADRNTQEDLPVIFECTKEQVAHSIEEITADTKAFVGPLEPDIFQKLPEGLEHIYISFPDKKIRREELEIGGKTGEQLKSELEAAGINISSYAESMLKSPEFTPSKTKEDATLIRLTVANLGFTENATTDQIYKRATDLGLELCTSDLGPVYLLNYQNQQILERVYIGMKQISTHLSVPRIFSLGGGMWLNGEWATPNKEWDPSEGFVFLLRKSEA